ncbi:eukaryotic translation initiation factor 4G-like isoform X1 [Nicotiana tomentosiformis]|uniref:eukaryotic translation initiation factor 4G-like isoform X1 n=2 Tax=Nicotiana tomentosiformis TaxID=4098 RepID=UPI00051BC17C|nr:eukaryotic translation initiation factor 4G-like isoform X1 [Nicotiana tomentosiformis]XP_009619116.1 eukaryotic translation initiation factor 4G-like isoform X1 [Nicotiana tomentosiformis]
MQRRGDQKKSESQTNYRRNSSRLSGRSGSAQPQYQRVTSGKGGGSSVLPPPSPDSSVSSSPTTPSFKKSDGETGSLKVTDAIADQESVDLQNDAPTRISGSDKFIEPTDTVRHDDYQMVSSDLSSQHASINLDQSAPKTPMKDDTSKKVSLQFGSFTPGFVNGMQIPQRTSSAPPNMDEQKRHQARSSPFRPLQLLSSSALHQPQLREDIGKPTNKTPDPQHFPERDLPVHVSPAHPVSNMQKLSSLPFPGVPVNPPFMQPHGPVHFGVPGAQVQHQGMPCSSFPMPMPLPVGNPNIRHPPFVPGLQPHHMQLQGAMHQGQMMNFPPKFGHQLSSQFGSTGFGISPQFGQHVRNVNPRRSVKITHPDTKEELRLDEKVDMRLDGGSSGLAIHHLGGLPSQPMHYGPSRPINFFPHVQPSPIFLQNPTSVPITNSLVAPCAPALGYNSPASVHVAVNQAPGSVGREILTSSFPIAKKTTEKEKAQQPALRASSNEEEPKILSETSVEVSESASKPTPFASPSDKSLVSVDRPPSSGATYVESNINHVRGVSDIETELKNPPNKSQLHPQQQREAGNPTSISNPSPPNSVDRISECQNAETIETQATSTLSKTLGDASICSGASQRNADEASEQSGVTIDEGNVIAGKGIRQGQLTTNPFGRPSLGIKNEDTYSSMTAKASEQTERNSHLATENGRNASDQLSSAGGCETNNVVYKLSHSAALSGRNISDVMVPGCGSPKYLTEDNELGSISPETRPAAKTNNKDVLLSGSGAKHHEDSHIPTSPSSPSYTKTRGKVSEETKTEYRRVQGSGSKDKPSNKVKSTTSRGKKKRREILQKADAAGDTLDLYMAFKGPKEKQQSSVSSESVESCTSLTARKISSSSNEEDFSANEDKKSTGEPNNWEDAAMSTPKLENSGNNKIVNDMLRHPNGGSATTGKMRYSRDFLLTLSSHFADLPANFEVPWHMVEALLSPNASISKGVDFNKNDPNSCPGQTNTRRQGSSSWTEHRPTGMADDSRWVNEQYIDINQGGSANGPRSGRGNHKNMRNLQGQPPSQYVSVFPAGAMLPLASHGGVQHIRSDANRWQRVSGSRKGLMPSPHSPLQVMHKADKKYEIRKVTDEEEAKRRQLKAILNKLTPQNFEKLFEQVKEVNIDSANTLAGVISQIFDKALMEPTFCEMYANFCSHLAGELPDFVEDDQKITFKRLLLDKCQEEFERGEREEAEADSMEEDGEMKMSEGKREEKRLQARRRMLGNIRLIGELYKKKMLTERIMHECIQKLLGQYQTPDEEDIEALCKLMSTIGDMIDHSKAKDYMDAYFDMMTTMANNTDLSSRVRFMLMDIIDLRKNKWQQRRKVEGPKKIEEVRRDAVQERRAQVTRSTRGPSTVSSSRRGQPADLGPRPSMFSPPAPQMTPFRGMTSQNRGFGNQDFRSESRHPHESRTSSAALPQRPVDDKTMSLGPRGSPGRATSFRGPPMHSGGPVADVHAGFGESRRPAAGSGGRNPTSGWSPYNSRQESTSKYAPGTAVKPIAYAQPNQREHEHYAEREVTNINPSGRSAEPPAAAHPHRPSAVSNSPGMIWSEERLREMSIGAIREFYSAVDEDEVVLRIRELNSSSFLPMMLSIWVNDSFQRKERDRDLLARLLISLTKSKVVPDISQLIEGFESVLATLEDEVTDAPKAPTFLGHIFGRLISENVISLKEAGHLIRHAGEEPGHLLQTGLGYEVLESTFNRIRSEKGESALRDICSASSTQLEDFRPPELS